MAMPEGSPIHQHVVVGTSNPDQEALSKVLDEISTILTQKGVTWSYAAPLFENFEIMEEFGVGPVQFGLMMCRLKMNRLKSCLARNPDRIAFDADALDSVKDLACYAILTMAMMKRSHVGR